MWAVSRCLKIVCHGIIFEVFELVWKTYLNVTDGQRDEQTTYCGITALCVSSRDKNYSRKCPRIKLLFSGYLILTTHVMCREVSKCYNDVNICLWTNGSFVPQSAAQSICEQRNSFLPRITNSNIQSTLRDFRSVAWLTGFTGGIWIDVKAVDPNDFHWIDGSSLAGFYLCTCLLYHNK